MINVKAKFILLLMSLFLLFCIDSNAQYTKIIGKITDLKTQETIPFVNITFKGTKLGTITDFNGNYKIETKLAVDSIIISCLGYKQIRKRVVRNKFQTLNIQIEPVSLELGEVVVSAKKRDKNNDPAIKLFNQIIKHKKQNNSDKLKSYQYETYNKVQFDINNVSEKFQNRRMLKPFKFIFDFMDTSIVNGKPYLPVFLIESLSDYYYRKNPKLEKEIIKATQVSGIDNESIQQFLGNMYIKVNIYENYMDLFGKGFISPISNTGRVFYKYFLVDSAFIDNNWCYQMVFQPRIKQEYVFNGNFWVADTSFAIKKIELFIDELVNINFINHLEIKQEFGEVKDSVWMITNNIVVVDFNVVEDPKYALGFFGRKTTTYKNFIINQVPDKRFSENIGNISVLDDANKKDTAFWNKSRHEELTEKEKQIYHMVDTIKNLPAFRTYYDIITMAITGYYVWGNVELGPYFTTYSYNLVEGHRFRLGGRTSNQFSTKIMPEMYVAYGTEDEKIKYGGNFIYLFKKNPRRGFGALYKYDMEQLGQSSNAFREDNIMSSVLRRSPIDKLSMLEEVKCHYEHEWFNGFSNHLIFDYREIYPIPQIETFIIKNGDEYFEHSTLTTFDITLRTRFAYNEKFVMGEFERASLGTVYPIIDIFYTYGIKDVFDSEFNYQKFEINIEDWFNIYPFGYSRYIINGGFIDGKLPFPLLKLHEGNETYSFDKYSFNMMNYYEFISDKYLSLYYSHYFEGFFFNKIPLFRRLKWREVIWGKGVVGTLRDENKEVMPFFDGMYTFDNPSKLNMLKPYLEAGVGVENIFRLFRFDVIQRLSYLDHSDISKTGFRISLQIKF